MKITLIVLLVTTMVMSQKKFNSDHFIQKHDLNLPEVTYEMLDVSNHIHRSDSWFYFYKDDSEKIDSVFRLLNIEGFPSNKRFEKHLHRNDSIFINSVSISQEDFDTTSNYRIIVSNDYQRETRFDLIRDCQIELESTPSGQRKSEKRKCRDDEEFSGVEFTFTPKDEYIESIEIRNGKPKFNDIRWYYITPFDSLCAEYIKEPDKDPFIIKLYTYTPFQKREYEYSLGIYSNQGDVIRFNFYTYTEHNQVERIYFFSLKNYPNLEDGFVLTNYTEYTYDSLGRKTSMITRVVPDKEGEGE
ncbi:hypothetical protein QA601_12570 [Chitinispirillales bacterium ANBcel5]|uniref:hypothetical protein n=1 Tax=Cellulosispirillum alkaliphilum TaxID=3039283 RepID=UPI002A56BD39|nr:hypothetical protein [Chitinispirillales bacterium ANBcel5]